jgi:hypothetical protein
VFYLKLCISVFWGIERVERINIGCLFVWLRKGVNIACLLVVCSVVESASASFGGLLDFRLRRLGKLLTNVNKFG